MDKMLVIALLVTLCAVSAYGQTYTCYVCNAQWYNGAWNGDTWCNATLGAPPASGGTQTGCAQCIREYWMLTGGEFIVNRYCETPRTGEAAELMQVAQTCYAFGIKGGNYERCACTSELCNACNTQDQCPVPNFQDCSIQVG